MRRRASFALAGAAVLLLAVASNLPASPAPAADWSRPLSISSAGMKVYYPRAWQAEVDRITIVLSSPRA